MTQLSPTAAAVNEMIEELLCGSMRRHTFRPAELEFLLDLDHCDLRKPARANLLRRYQRAMLHEANSQGGSLLRLAEFVAQRSSNRRK